MDITLVWKFIRQVALLFKPVRQIRDQLQAYEVENKDLVRKNAILLNEVTHALEVKNSALRGEVDAKADIGGLEVALEDALRQHERELAIATKLKIELSAVESERESIKYELYSLRIDYNKIIEHNHQIIQMLNQNSGAPVVLTNNNDDSSVNSTEEKSKNKLAEVEVNQRGVQPRKKQKSSAVQKPRARRVK